MNFKTYSTPFLTSDTTEVPTAINLDSLKKLIPNGIYFLTENGARKSIKAKIDAQAFYEKLQITDQALGDMANKVSLVTVQRNQAIDLNMKNEAIITGLTKKLFWAKFWKWTAISGAAVLTTKIAIQK